MSHLQMSSNSALTVDDYLLLLAVAGQTHKRRMYREHKLVRSTSPMEHLRHQTSARYYRCPPQVYHRRFVRRTLKNKSASSSRAIYRAFDFTILLARIRKMLHNQGISISGCNSQCKNFANPKTSAICPACLKSKSPHIATVAMLINVFDATWIHS